MRRANAALLLFCFLALVGMTTCRGRAPEGIRGEALPVTADGLHLVVDEADRKLYLKPGIALEDFSQLLIDPFMVSYTNPRDGSDGPVRTLDGETEERLASAMHDALGERMERSRVFEVVDRPGPQALRVQGWLYDVVVEAPPFDDPRNFSLCFAEMGVILTLRHSQTAQALARVLHRARFSCSEEGGRRYRTTEWRDVKEGLKPWARLLGSSLESLRAGGGRPLG